MEKKGELLNQLAIISDLLEKVNAETKSTTIVFELSNMEFDRVFQSVQKKYGSKLENPKGKFNITIGLIDIVFNTNNV
jgi:hypothetical protein